MYISIIQVPTDKINIDIAITIVYLVNVNKMLPKPPIRQPIHIA